MGKNLQDFSKFGSVNPAIGSYEYQLKREFEEKIECIQRQLDELRTEFENTFG